jgi:hypothetical protein
MAAIAAVSQLFAADRRNGLLLQNERSQLVQTFLRLSAGLIQPTAGNIQIVRIPYHVERIQHSLCVRDQAFDTRPRGVVGRQRERCVELVLQVFADAQRQASLCDQGIQVTGRDGLGDLPHELLVRWQGWLDFANEVPSLSRGEAGGGTGKHKAHDNKQDTNH